MMHGGPDNIQQRPAASHSITQQQMNPFDAKALAIDLVAPRIPLPEDFVHDIMVNLVLRLRPVLNAYLQSHPLLLPVDEAIYVPHPVIKVWHIKGVLPASVQTVSLQCRGRHVEGVTLSMGYCGMCTSP